MNDGINPLLLTAMNTTKNATKRDIKCKNIAIGFLTFLMYRSDSARVVIAENAMMRANLPNDIVKPCIPESIANI